ncbi:GNAT domain-containing protein [Lineolata rhizophorae]|uniref:GNAT domain-containing protein n=1 Tax=Lineolata rhizophorae TaxID=578093 RepID=A0A6A6P1W0_9PEZI|nr:GNAT domain-containing protein [Lineolata rhizophorae]
MDTATTSSSTAAPQPVDEIRTRRMVLRPIRKDDAHDFFSLRSRPEVMYYTLSEPDTELRQTETWLAERLAQPDYWSFAIELLPSTDQGPIRASVPSHGSQDSINSDPAVVAAVAAAAAPSPPRSPTTKRPVIGILGIPRQNQIGYLLQPAFWGHGLATEALRAFMPRFFAHVAGSYEHAVAFTLPGNGASRKVLEKVGFRLVKEEGSGRDGNVEFHLERKDWEEKESPVMVMGDA